SSSLDASPSSSADADVPGCACPDTPKGWFGPVALWEGTNTPPACPSAYSALARDVYSGLTAPTAQCECDCVGPTGSQCLWVVNSNVVSGWPGSRPSFVGAPTDGSCVRVASSAGAQVDPAAATGGSCVAQPKVTAPTSWARRARLCKSTVPPSGDCTSI